MDCRAFRGLETAPLRDLLAALERSYCGTLGVEYLSLSDKAQREWTQERVERAGNQPSLTPEERRRILELLVAAETLEQFLHAKFVGQKRFSLEGAEALIPLLDTLVEDAAAADVDEMVMGMPHRGRLNVLAHTLRKPYELILGEFEAMMLALLLGWLVFVLELPQDQLVRLPPGARGRSGGLGGACPSPSRPRRRPPHPLPGCRAAGSAPRHPPEKRLATTACEGTARASRRRRQGSEGLRRRSSGVGDAWFPARSTRS